MKIVLVGINATYDHTNLAIQCLRRACLSRSRFSNELDISCREFSINDPLLYLLSSLRILKADIYGFSCYIWNIEIVLKLARDLSVLMPEVCIVLGGPEVSFDTQTVLSANPYIQQIFAGAGESAFTAWVDEQISKTFEEKGIVKQKPQTIQNIPFTELDFPYSADNEPIGNQQIYYESSRGCPFSCSYCLSSVLNQVEELPAERTIRELLYFIKKEAKTVKIVDRTFNLKDLRARAIWRELIDYTRKYPHETMFHFEIAGDLLSEETISVLSMAPKGLLRFEIGVQTVNFDTLKAVNRISNIGKLLYFTSQILARTSVEVHMDLIAGLPGERLEDIIRSFNAVLSLRPHVIQLGFLKLLKGTSLRRDASGYGIEYSAYPPYEILCSDSMSFESLFRLKQIARLTDQFYNSGKYNQSVTFLLMQSKEGDFALFDDMTAYFSDHHLLWRNVSRKNQNEALVCFANRWLAGSRVKDPCRYQDTIKTFKDLMKFDYYTHDRYGNIDSIDFQQGKSHPELPEGVKDPRWSYYTERRTCVRPRIEKYSMDPMLFSAQRIIRPEITFLLYDLAENKPRIVAKITMKDLIPDGI